MRLHKEMESLADKAVITTDDDIHLTLKFANGTIVKITIPAIYPNVRLCMELMNRHLVCLKLIVLKVLKWSLLLFGHLRCFICRISNHSSLVT